MKKPNSNEVKRGQTISFRVPSDIPDHLLKHLQNLKETERRNFSSKIADFVVQGLGSSISKERETISLPLPYRLSKSQRDWLKHEHSEALLGSILYHLLTDPIRSTALLASLNSNALDINEALYLQEEETSKDLFSSTMEETAAAAPIDVLEDDLDAFKWESLSEDQEEEKEEVDNNLENLLGDFLAKMNK
jgi:hypothetical protein